MSFKPVVAAALSGASTGQLAYWRSARTSEPLLAPEFCEPRARVSYSFQDVVALRTFVYLRSQRVPLQRIRKGVASLRDLGATEHLANYALVAAGRDVAWKVSAEEAVDLTNRPGHQIIAQMVDILAPFENVRRQAVLDLRRPTPGVEVDPDIRGGFPVVEGTRVPYDLVSSLIDDGLDAAEVASIYPSVLPAAAQGASDFARYVDEFSRPRVAA